MDKLTDKVTHKVQFAQFFWSAFIVYIMYTLVIERDDTWVDPFCSVKYFLHLSKKERKKEKIMLVVPIF